MLSLDEDSFARFNITIEQSSLRGAMSMKTSKLLTFWGAFLMILTVLQSEAAINSKDIFKGTLTKSGVLRGGTAGIAFTLKDIRRTASNKQKTERVVIEFGDRHGNPMKGEPAYYNIELMDRPIKRVVIDLAQTNIGTFSESFIAQRFLNSKLVQKASVVMEAQNSYTSIILDLKKNIEAKVYNVKGNTKGSAKLVLDLVEHK
jgi:hypothetical protein